MVRSKDEGGSALERLREFGLRYPGAHTKSPWPGHLDLAVNDKTFAYLSIAGEPLRISCKLPRSADAALELPFTTPTAYGLGKSGWVTAEFPDGAGVPVELLEEWIDESYRAQAPKRLSARLPPFAAGGSGGADVRGASVADETDEPPAGKPASPDRSSRPRRSTVKRADASATAATPGRSSKRAAKKAARRAASTAASKPVAAKVTAGARRTSRRSPVPVSSALAKREGVSPRARKRPAKKSARSRA